MLCLSSCVEKIFKIEISAISGAFKALGEYLQLNDLKKMASSSYDVQLQIRRAAEERSAAHQDLVSWIDHVAVQGCKETDKKRTTKASENINAKDHSTTSLKDAQISSIDRSHCEDERLRGNNFFALGNYHDAIACYTRCLGNKDALTSPLVYSNRGKNKSSRFTNPTSTLK